MGMARKKGVLAALLGAAAIAGLTTLILLVQATRVLLPADTKFGMVFDAGSSHTSLYLYRWPADKENDTGVVSQALVCEVEGPGIAAYASRPAEAGAKLQPCLREALALVPEAQHPKTPLFLGATAGMRLLEQKNRSQADGILAAVAQALRGSPADFRAAGILSGAHEGAFGWISTNYVLEQLIKYSFSGEWTHSPAEKLVGALDLGGASTQITFVPEGPILDASSRASFRLYGASYSVYTRSYLCFGRDQMLTRLLAQLLPASRDLVVEHPCYHRGYQAAQPLQPLLESPCVPADLGLGPGPGHNLTVKGVGDPQACAGAIRRLFNFSSCENQKDCAFDGAYQPPVRGPFYAFSSFYYTFSFLNLTSGQSLDTANTTVWTFCQKTWEQVKAEAPGQEQDKFLPGYCSTGMYILTLLRDGYGFNQDTWSGIEFRKQVSGTDIGWTLGYMLNLTNMIPEEAPAQRRAQSCSVWTASVVFAALTLVAVLGAAAVQLFWPWG
ncbi:ectonucleoside triphosphate diphosphohydrolase 8 [Talpa occidentalis]|uniref:ectonucleoside triphosphate diphosphohydrolase 8 n=1 Tax=Talpa occidentalis TaxID=50954 RepID=UPI00188F6845|nr:ectonucleoside triphosphate diphosphohydrolase 8 [Talpa occidentalis]